MNQILTVNCGSSSVKLALFQQNHSRLEPLDKVIVERVDNHAEAIQAGIQKLDGFQPEQLVGIGHRVVHGGPHFSEAVQISTRIKQQITACIEFAPLHNPANLAGIDACQAQFDVPQVAIFDTAFHANMPAYASTYALPADITASLHIRRYGFHGTSHEYVGRQAATMLDKPFQQSKIITLHLGNGASACAIKNGQSIDTTMGFTPLEGLVMGTRCGDIDPALFGILQDKLGKTADEIDHLLNKQSGLKGIAGSNDMRDLLASNEPTAQLALEVFCYKIRKTIGAYLAALADEGGAADAIIFTAGIGENSAEIRQRCCEGLASLGLQIDPEANCHTTHGEISTSNSTIKIMVIPTNEALMLAQQTLQTL